MAFQASATRIAAADGNGYAYLWLYTLIGSQANPESQGVLSVAYSPDGKFLAAADGNGRILHPTRGIMKNSHRSSDHDARCAEEQNG